MLKFCHRCICRQAPGKKGKNIKEARTTETSEVTQHGFTINEEQIGLAGAGRKREALH